jgi:hypothetical protein
MLNLAVYEPLPAAELTRPNKHRSPSIALALSMLFPGLGHLYIGLRRNAAWIIGFESLSILLLLFGAGTLRANAVLAAPILYCFAMADAFFSAREWNAGVTPLMVGTNPRIAAVLNLLTKGFGYFYLGDRTKGILCFFIASAIQAALLIRTNAWTVILAITVQIAIALDGYRVARLRLFVSHPELAPTRIMEDGSVPGNAVDLANPGGLNPSFATGFFVVFSAVTVMGYGAIRALDGHAVVSHGALDLGPSGLVYQDAQEKITVTIPEDWSSERTKDSLALFVGPGASLIMQEQFATYTVASLLSKTEADIKRRHSDASTSPCETQLGKHRALCFETSFHKPDGTAVTQRIVAYRRFFKIFILVETWTTPENRPVFARIEQNLQFR